MRLDGIEARSDVTHVTAVNRVMTVPLGESMSHCYLRAVAPDAAVPIRTLCTAGVM